ncbi:signal transduction histidine kinase [Nocardiopsis sp. Huas11]|uniref:sensor histidine kinase n=1 Tax=Nocardiopsis sp. Huas11 TaxID=2183912 RepID=UPI000EAF96CB|nr:histidine kinase [Nocardiopsis sp. Huas11]RKS05926.1 signal transduction histidine kinase [Nocardiopsis sp. Huas11]
MREILRRRAHLLPDLLLWAVLATATVLDLIDTPSPLIVAETAMALLCLTAALVLARSRPGAALAVATAFPLGQQFVFVLGLVDRLSLVPLVTVAVIAFLAGQRSARVGPVITITLTVVLILLGLVAAQAVVSGSDARDFLSRLVDWLGAALVTIATVVAPWLFGRYLPWHHRLARGGWEVAERMERARAADADRARLRERTRIASQMHDSLGHDLALIAVRAAALEMASTETPEQRDAAAELRASAHEANLRLREIIGVLREETEVPAAEPVADLVQRATDAGMAVRLLREGPDPDPAEPGGRAAHRVVQEALTNAARYAPGTEVAVTVVRLAGRTRIDVEDTGPAGDRPAGHGGAVPPRDGQGGSGLAALRAQVEGLGGTFRAGSAGRGFAVHATVPDTGDAGVDPADAGPGAPATAGARAGGEPTETRRAHDEVRVRARRSLAVAVGVPLALAAVLTVVGFSLLSWISAHSVLPPESYERLSVGDTRAEVEPVLPRFAYPERSVDPLPPEPPGAECDFYLVTTEGGLPPVYRLCFVDGVLADKGEFDRIDR